MTGEEPLCSLTESVEIRLRSKIVSGAHALRMWLDVLKVAPFLTEFIAYFHRYTDPPPLPRAPSEPLIRLSNLRVLKLLKNDYTVDPTSFIIDYVTLPNLRVLFFTSNGRDRIERAEMLTSFIRRSLPPLTTLVMDWWVYVHEELIIPILHLLPTLKYLRLWGAKVTGRFFRELTAPSNTSAISRLGGDYNTVCPVLETLFLQDIDFEGDADLYVAFSAMLRSRPRGLGQSKVVYLRGESSLLRTVEFSVLDENIGESWQAVKEHVLRGGMVIGNYEAVDSLLMDGSLGLGP